jgi:hypothetical protein
MIKPLQFILVLLAGLLISCDKKSGDCGDPYPSICRLYLVDSNDSLLVGQKYSVDSVRLYYDTFKIKLNIDNGIIIFSYTNKIIWNKDLILYLNKNDQDTLRLSVGTVIKECWSVAEIDTFKYNNSVIKTFTGNSYKIQK